MGIHFRDGSYCTYVRWGKRTIKDGEAAAIWDRLGRHTQVVGPRLVYLFYATVRFLYRHTAGPNQFLRVVHKDGRIEHVRGPVTMFLNPVYHHEILLREIYSLPSPCDCLIVYAEQTNDVVSPAAIADEKGIQLVHAHARQDGLQRRVIRGPAKYVPAVNESVHMFDWTAGKFEVLRTSQTRWEVDVQMRSADSTMLELRLTVLLHIESVDALLDTTSNPFNDLKAALQADVAVIGPQLARDEFKTVLGLRLAQLDTYPMLCGRAHSIGIIIDDVTFRGYSLPPEMQKQVDESERMHAKLARDRAEAAQRDELVLAELAARRQRMTSEMELERSRQHHELQLAAERHEAEASRRAAADKEVVDFLRDLRSFDVDLTKFLCATAKPHKGLVAASPAFTNLMGTVGHPDMEHKED